MTLSLAALRAGGKPALAAALGHLEAFPEAPDTLDLLDAAYAAPLAHVVGITGPPGVGKSTLVGALIRAWRRAARSVAVIAVDPSSRLTGGALLGDRMRLRTDPGDPQIFVRSMAARDRFGGLAALTHSAMVLMRALYDVVVIETVGVGQSETDVGGAADTVILCLQPGSGDSLQFMKAGIVEIPEIMVVTKADLGDAAERARVDAAAALQQSRSKDSGYGDPDLWRVPVLSVSAGRDVGIAMLIDTIDAHRAWLSEAGRLARRRQAQEVQWVREALREAFGREGLRRLEAIATAATGSPFRQIAGLGRALSLRGA